MCTTLQKLCAHMLWQVKGEPRFDSPLNWIIMIRIKDCSRKEHSWHMYTRYDANQMYFLYSFIRKAIKFTTHEHFKCHYLLWTQPYVNGILKINIVNHKFPYHKNHNESVCSIQEYYSVLISFFMLSSGTTVVFCNVSSFFNENTRVPANTKAVPIQWWGVNGLWKYQIENKRDANWNMNCRNLH